MALLCRIRTPHFRFSIPLLICIAMVSPPRQSRPNKPLSQHPLRHPEPKSTIQNGRLPARGRRSSVPRRPRSGENGGRCRENNEDGGGENSEAGRMSHGVQLGTVTASRRSISAGGKSSCRLVWRLGYLFWIFEGQVFVITDGIASSIDILRYI
jgi:hypothetical protein